MTKYRDNLPQLGKQLFLTDGGMETTLVFHENIDLPCFAAITLLTSKKGEKQLYDYFHRYLSLFNDYKTGFILESVTWRGSRKWMNELGFSESEHKVLNQKAVKMLFNLREQYETTGFPIIISGCIGPYGDGYNAEEALGIEASEEYHVEQIKTLAEAGADVITAMTINSADEAIGMTRAAQQQNIPMVISFTLETDGRLPSGQSLESAILEVDLATEIPPVYYMINCAHPSHFVDVLQSRQHWQTRIRGIRANASCKSHAELDESTELDIGDVQALGMDYQILKEILPNLTVLGGCCGTDHRHIEAIAKNICV